MSSQIDFIEPCGQINEKEINEMSLLLLMREGGDMAVMRFSTATDQSGLVGLMCHLHGFGYVLRSISCQP